MCNKAKTKKKKKNDHDVDSEHHSKNVIDSDVKAERRKAEKIFKTIKGSTKDDHDDDGDDDEDMVS